MVAVSRNSENDGVLLSARVAYRRQEWADAFALFSEADADHLLAEEDLELFVWSAALSARDDVMLEGLERLHRVHVEKGACERAAQCAFWLGFRLLSLGEKGRGMGWLQRSRRLIDELSRESVVQGYLLLPVAHKNRAEGNFKVAAAAACEAAAIGEKFNEPDLVTLARQLHGSALIHDGNVDEGIALLDEVMLAVSDGETSPLIAGLVYCSVIATCCHIYAMDRAREWTEALSKWCDAQPQLGLFNASCMVHRSEIMQMNGEWPEALEEAQHASRNLENSVDRDTAAAAQYQQGEIHRLQGNFRAAEACYREASRLGREPYPGLALLRLAEGKIEDAAAAIGRVTAAGSTPLGRVKFLPAFVEIMLANNSIEEAADASAELNGISNEYGTEILEAIASDAQGLVAWARGDARAALPILRHAFSIWQNVGALYIAARIRTRIAAACNELGDVEGALMELDAAKAVFEDIGALPDLAEIEKLRPGRKRGKQNLGLSSRELEVLALIASGSTNRAMAEELGLSIKTIDRHVANIFDKLDVTSRAAAAARAFREEIL
jgi:ATP/maltotriose-dependent transcriptional regulator MalT